MTGSKRAPQWNPGSSSRPTSPLSSADQLRGNPGLKVPGQATEEAPLTDIRITIQNVTKRYSSARGTKLILDDISMTVPSRRIVSLVGPTGCGKTTLLNIIAGFETQTSGVVTMDGAPIDGPSPARGYVSQEANLFPWLTVWDNVRFAARFGKGIRQDWETTKELDEKVAAYLARVGLEAARSQYPHQISGGMKARAALGRVLLMNSSVLLLDEPFAALDALTRSEMHRLLLHMFRDGDEKTGLLITHDVEEALLLSEIVYVMSASPAKIIESINVPFGWPREYDYMVQAPELAHLKFQVLEALRPFVDKE